MRLGLFQLFLGIRFKKRIDLERAAQRESPLFRPKSEVTLDPQRGLIYPGSEEIRPS